MNTLSVRIKRLSLILALLIAANAATYLVAALNRGASGERRALLNTDQADIARIEFSESDASLSLIRSGSDWFVEDGPRRLKARGERVQSLLDTLGAPRSLKRVARSVDARDRLGLGSASTGLRVLGADGRSLLELSSGAYDASGRSVFIALAESNESWSTDPGFASYLGVSRKAWLDLRLGGPVIDASEVVAISAKGTLNLDPASGERYEADLHMERDVTGTWRLSGSPEPALDGAAVDRAVRMLLGFEADDFADELAAKRVAAEKDLALSLKLADGSERSWSLAEAGTGRFEGISSETPFAFEASAYRLRSALPNLENLKAKP